MSTESKKRVLIVDDDKEVCETFKAELTQFGLEVHIAFNGAQAFDIFYEQGIDLIVSDYKMPNLDGIEFLEEIVDRKLEVPIILMTGHAEEEENLKIRPGVRKVLIKPFTSRDLFESINSILQKEGEYISEQVKTG